MPMYQQYMKCHHPHRPIKEVMEDGHVPMEAGPHDRRGKRLRLTTRGARLGGLLTGWRKVMALLAEDMS